MKEQAGIKTYIEGYKEYLLILRGRASGTVKRYVRALEVFDEWLTNRGGAFPPAPVPAASVTHADVEAWMKDLFYHHGNLQNISRAAKLSALKSFWQYLKYSGVIEANPLALIPSPKVQRPMPQKFSTSQLRRIFTAPDLSTHRGVRDMAILKLLYGSGPRVDEIRELNVDSLHVSGSDIYLHYTKTKGGKERIVHLRRNPSEALVRWLTFRASFVADGEQALFVSMSRSASGVRMSAKAYNEILKKYAVMAGITSERVFVHKMRATFATDLYDLGFGVLEISYLMGHDSVETTQRYIAISETALKKTAIPDRRWRELEERRVDGEGEGVY